VFLRYKLARRDGLHWTYARCLQMPTADLLARWNKQRRQQLERVKAAEARAEGKAVKAAAVK
jgi:hypothetical protein